MEFESAIRALLVERSILLKILMVEDDSSLAKSLRLNLELDGYHTYWTRSLNEAREIEPPKVDLVVLDLNLPDGHGFDLLAEVRARAPKLPVVVLTAVTDPDVVVEAIQRGANDYVRKPFAYKELLVRIKAILRQPMYHEKAVRYGDLSIFPESRVVKCGEQSVDLHRREFDVFYMLIERAESIISRKQMLERLDAGGEIFDRTIDVHISNIRAALKKAGVVSIKISSVYGIGYRLEKA